MKTPCFSFLLLTAFTLCTTAPLAAQQNIQQKRYRIQVISDGDTLMSKDSIWTSNGTPKTVNIQRTMVIDTAKIGNRSHKIIVIGLQGNPDSTNIDFSQPVEEWMLQGDPQIEMQWLDSITREEVRLLGKNIPMMVLTDSLMATPFGQSTPVFAPFNKEVFIHRNNNFPNKGFPHRQRPNLQQVNLSDLPILQKAGLSPKQLMSPSFEEVNLKILAIEPGRLQITFEAKIPKTPELTILRIDPTGKILSRESVQKIEGTFSRTIDTAPNTPFYWVIYTNKQLWANKWGFPPH